MSNENDQHQGQYPPSQWESHPARGPYPQAVQPGGYYPGPSTPQPYQQPSSGAPGEMVTLPPPQAQHQQDLYRHPTYDMYQNHPQHVAFSPNPHDPSQHASNPPMSFSQPAPRQRTAIACRYCRRRKIRCHGFDSSPDGRCTNCIRFHQDCIFTPVSSQAHAFVPAHAAYPHLRNTARMHQPSDGRLLYPQQGQPLIYGAHGQPLGPVPAGQDPGFAPAPSGYGSAHAPHPGAGYDDRGMGLSHPPEQVSRKRSRADEAAHPVIPTPPHTASSHAYPVQARGPSAAAGRRSSGTTGYEYPDPTHMAPVSPASSTASYQSTPYPSGPPQPYFPPQPPARRPSPPSSAYPYDGRASGSPHGSSSSTATYAAFAGSLHPPQVLPPTRETGRTPPPEPSREGSSGGNGSASRAGMSVRDMLGPGEGPGGARSSADSDMLKALNRRGM